jgi:hypothetical protein
MASKKIFIEYDIDSSDLKIANGETLSLTQQLKILKRELQRGDLKPEQFDILRKKIGDTEDRIAKTTVKSKDFFGVLSSLPGPVGQFGSSLLSVVDTLKIFSSFSFKDIKNSLSDIGDDISDITENFSNFGNTTEQTNQSTQQLTQANNALSNSLQGGSTAAGAAAAATSNLTQQTQLLKIATDANGQKTIVAVKSFRDMTEAERALFKEQRNRLVHTGQVIQQQETLNNSLDKGSTAAKGLAVSLRGIGTALGIGALIAGITILITKFIEWASKVGEATEQQKAATKAIADFKTKLFEVQNAIKAAKEGVISKEEALKQYNDKLGTTVGFAKNLDEAERLLAANTDTVIQSIRLRAEAQVFYAKSAEAAAKAISGEGLQPDFWERTFNVIKAGGNTVLALSNDLQTVAENFGKLNQESAKFAAEGDELIKKALELEKTLQGTRTKPEDGKNAADEAYRRLLADLDARIQLEINKENTSREILSKLLDKRAKMVIEKEKLTVNQVALLRQENSKKIDAALQEDSDRTMAFLQKRNEIMINAQKDEQDKEEQLLAEKLYFDKVAISKDTEFRKKSKDEQYQIFLDMEEKYQQDLLRIKEKYFLKEFDKQREADKLRRDNTLTEGEMLLELNQNLLTRKISLNDYFETLFTNNNKKLFEGYFVDLRKLYTQNYRDTELSLIKELLALKKANEDKKLSNEEYAKKVAEINQQIIDNKNQYTQQVINLDDLEKTSREAVVDRFSELAQRTVDFFNALIDIRQVDMDNQMKRFDEQLALYSEDSDQYKKILKEKRQAEEDNLEKIKQMQTAAALADAAVQIARVIIDTQRAIVSFAASVAPLGPAGIPIAAAYATSSKILAALSIATITAQGISKIKQIQGQSASTPQGGGKGLVRGMAKGGMIEGKRHSEGGVLIEAEGGEAVMTRGAVSMFGPLLSMMNQAGGGTNFNKDMMTTANDAPLTKNVSEQSPMILKTYVVSNELTTEMEKQARLKNLSTL